jgi:hypothetical protein
MLTGGWPLRLPLYNGRQPVEDCLPCFRAISFSQVQWKNKFTSFGIGREVACEGWLPSVGH